MSITFRFKENLFLLDKLKLPTRYYYFDEKENYVKLLSIGEGIFPKDRIHTKIVLQDSNVIVSTESATKVYASKKEFGINYIDINLNNSNLEFINDELIVFKDAKFIQLLRLKSDKQSTFFYADILSHGRSFEEYDFEIMAVKNSFYVGDEIEYLEKYRKKRHEIKSYLSDFKSSSNLFAKIYIKLDETEHFLNSLKNENFNSFEYTKNKEMIIGVLSEKNMANLKENVKKVWEIYRKTLNKNPFHLGKQ